MPLEPRDLALLDDIRRAGAEALGFIAKMDEPTFLKDIRTQRAVERELEIIGEASRSLSDEARAHYPQVPFRAVIGMRNILAHDYGRVDPKELWQTVKEALPILLGNIGAGDQGSPGPR